MDESYFLDKWMCDVNMDESYFLDRWMCDVNVVWMCDDLFDEEIETFETYMSRVHDPIIDSYKISSQFYYAYIPDIHRANFKSMVDFLNDLHGRRLSLESLEESNIVFHWKKLKFRGLKIDRRFLPANRAKDFQLLHDVITKLIDKYNHKKYGIPETFRGFLRAIDDLRNGVTRSEDCLPFLMGIQSHYATRLMIINFGQPNAIQDASEKGRYHTVLEKMYRRDEYKRDWAELFKGSHPEVGLLADCFNHKFDANKTHRYRSQGSAREVNCSMLRFCRNIAVHLHEHMKNHNGGAACTDRDYDLTIMAFFDKELLSFQKLIFEHDIAHRFIEGYPPPVSFVSGPSRALPVSSVSERRQESNESGSAEPEFQLVVSKRSKRNQRNSNRGRP